MDTTKFDNTDGFKQGLKVRTEVLGEGYVGPSLERASADPFNRKLQQWVTEHCWGTVWCSDVLDRKTRSLMNLAMLAALGREGELRLHTRGALNNGITREEIKEAFLQVGIYCGAPAAIESFRLAREVFEEIDG